MCIEFSSCFRKNSIIAATESLDDFLWVVESETVGTNVFRRKSNFIVFTFKGEGVLFTLYRLMQLSMEFRTFGC